ncbi:hypothetical protein KSX_82790 [Ktedonospora formicarum]|uniref:Uncharacterized protein n=1 Tax=Ktedonospora formicarum TaxID=2778364 RepID=A0A8J3I9X5_9CHLR|nr:hypothetical protein KSX_82790 [Ktedonospora formicarum]
MLLFYGDVVMAGHMGNRCGMILLGGVETPLSSDPYSKRDDCMTIQRVKHSSYCREVSRV